MNLFSKLFCDVFSPIYYTLSTQILPFPTMIHLEVTNYCNANCYFCPHQVLRRKFGYMDLTLFQKAVDEIGQYGVQTLNLHLLGEPLLHPEIFDMVAYAKTKERIQQVSFSTNGSLLNESRIDKLINSGLDSIVISMDGATAATYEHARGKLNFNAVVNNLKHLIEAVTHSESQRPFITIQAIQTPEIEKEMGTFHEFWGPLIEGKPFIVLTAKRYDWWGDFKSDDVHSEAHWGTPGPWYVRMPCRMLEYQLNMFWTGKTIPCCLDANGELNIGNFPEQSLMEIWQGEPLKQLRRQFRKGLQQHISPCRDCIYGSAKRFFSWKDISFRYVAKAMKNIQNHV